MGSADARRVWLPSAIGTMTRLAFAHAKAKGITVEPLLTKAGLTLRQIEDPHVRLKVRDQIDFLDLAANAVNDDFLGFHLAQQPDLREMGLLYYVLASSDTMIDAFRRVARYSSFVNDGISLKCIDARFVGLSLHFVGVSRHRDRHQIEATMTVLMRICRQLTGLRLMPSRVRFAHHRKSSRPGLSEFFGDTVEFGASVDELTFAARVRSLPVVGSDPYLNKLLTAYCDEALADRQRARGSFRSSVENAVAPLLPHGKVCAGEIARRLGASQRTFARRLSSEGLTFSALVESLRSDLAHRHLADGDLSISQIAWLLGYREVGAFSHAFKRWTGKTPREARAGA